jgi:predicted TIM-barrel fold metal-dependent hydrolase
MNLRNVPIIDSHCHPFDPEKGSKDFRSDFNCSLWKPPMEIVENTIFNYKMIRELGKYLNLPNGSSQNMIVNERNKQYKNDPKKYIHGLFKSVNLDTLLVDTGFPHEEFTGYSVDLNIFRELVPCKVYPIYRLATTIFRIFKNLPPTFEEAIEIVKKDMNDAIEKDKVVAFKSIIAYETGLEIKQWSDSEAKESYKRFVKEKQRADEKVLRDYITVLGLKKCHDNSIPMQFHTGIGSAPVLDLREANPILMQDILAVDEIKETDVVITHSGHPFNQETGYLTSIYPNLYCDVTAICPYFGTALKQAFLKLFEMAPVNRIMYGTDGGVVPETYWFGALQGIKDLEAALEELIKSDWITKEEAVHIANLIINKNAKLLYKI